jgi:hypothetical protein
MTPYAEAAAVYDREPCARCFAADLALHLAGGFVFSTPKFFIMGRAVRRDAPLACIVDPAFAFARESADCWHVYLMAGDVAAAWSVLPWSLPWISFERKNELRVYSLSDIRRLSPAA